jgi:ribosomal protein S18 acetylase RimI-like enzyme
VIRPATPADEQELAALDRANWSTLMTPTPYDPERKFFNEKTKPEDVLVAQVDGRIAGYAKLSRVHEIPASDHVLHLNGLSVLPEFRRRGIGRALLDAVAAEARARGARRLTLRVLGHNEGARTLYEQSGFVVEGVLRDEFFLDGAYRDDVAMALDLTAAVS